MQKVHQIEKIKEVLQKELYTIEPVTKDIDKDILPLIYSPGVGTVCEDIHQNPALAIKYTIRQRAVAVVSDGSLLDCPEKAFLPVMDWFIFQLKKLSGIDAYPFVVMKDADLTKVFANLANSYAGVVYLDGVKEFAVPANCLVLSHRRVVELTKCARTDASYTAHALSYFMGKGRTGEPDILDYETAINAPQVITKREFAPFHLDESGIDSNARRFHEHFQGTSSAIKARLR